MSFNSNFGVDFESLMFVFRHHAVEMLLSYHLFPHTFLMLIKVPQSFMSNAWMWIYWWHCAKQKWLLIQNVKCSAKYIAMKTWEMCSVFGGVGTRLCYIVCKKEKVNKNKNICNIFRPIDSLKGEKLKSWPWTSRAATVQAHSSVFRQRSHVCQQGSESLVPLVSVSTYERRITGTQIPTLSPVFISL